MRALSMHEVEYNAQLDQAAVEHQEEWQLSEQQLGAILRLKGPKKVSAVAGAIRTSEFMRRYYSELHGREERLRELQRDWWQVGSVAQLVPGLQSSHCHHHLPNLGVRVFACVGVAPHNAMSHSCRIARDTGGGVGCSSASSPTSPRHLCPIPHSLPDTSSTPAYSRRGTWAGASRTSRRGIWTPASR